MRAVVMKHGQLELKDIPEPRLGPGQLLVEPIAAGVCGGDLNALTLTDVVPRRVPRRSDMRTFLFDPDRDLVFGHEFTSHVLEVGAGVEDYAPGDTLLNLPLVLDDEGVAHCVGTPPTTPVRSPNGSSCRRGGSSRSPNTSRRTCLPSPTPWPRASTASCDPRSSRRAAPS